MHISGHLLKLKDKDMQEKNIFLSIAEYKYLVYLWNLSRNLNFRL